MKPTLQPGLSLELAYTVTREMKARHLDVVVLSTPAMIEWIEMTCLECVKPHLDDSELTVGTHVNVSHAGPAFEGEEFRVKTALKEINKRRLLFDVEVHSPRGVIGQGTHERAVVDAARFKT